MSYFPVLGEAGTPTQAEWLSQVIYLLTIQGKRTRDPYLRKQTLVKVVMLRKKGPHTNYFELLLIKNGHARFVYIRARKDRIVYVDHGTAHREKVHHSVIEVTRKTEYSDVSQQERRLEGARQ